MLDTSKASVPNGISAKMLKNTAQSIYPSLMHLFNISICNGRIPQEWKLSSVVLIPKSNNKKENPTNYRPISLLSISVNF